MFAVLAGQVADDWRTPKLLYIVELRSVVLALARCIFDLGCQHSTKVAFCAGDVLVTETTMLDA